MKQVKVLGSGCAKCEKTAELIQRLADELNIEVEVVKETDMEVIMNYGVMSTPAVVIDGEVMHSGSIPKTIDIKKWLSE